MVDQIMLACTGGHKHSMFPLPLHPISLLWVEVFFGSGVRASHDSILPPLPEGSSSPRWALAYLPPRELGGAESSPRRLIWQIHPPPRIPPQGSHPMGCPPQGWPQEDFLNDKLYVLIGLRSDLKSSAVPKHDRTFHNAHNAIRL